jgi:hypothetical protein
MKVKESSASSSSRSIGESDLRNGQIVRGRVVAQVGAGRFRVAAAGSYFNAASELPLQPGQVLTARVELGKSQLFLRLIGDEKENSGRNVTSNDPSEIQRILTGLGYTPDDHEISEFRHRLQRYGRPEGSGHDEPSDIWVLAILWTRGIRSGADHFALLSYYLRHLPLHPIERSPMPSLEFLLAILSDSASDRTTESTTLKLGSDHFWNARKQEAQILLNRDSQQNGYYEEVADVEGTFFLYSFRDGEQSYQRIVDHPVSSNWELEIGRSAGNIVIQLFVESSVQSQINTGIAEHILELSKQAAVHELDLRDAGVHELDGREALRFRFWKKWQEETERGILV